MNWANFLAFSLTTVMVIRYARHIKAATRPQFISSANNLKQKISIILATDKNDRISYLEHQLRLHYLERNLRKFTVKFIFRKKQIIFLNMHEYLFQDMPMHMTMYILVCIIFNQKLIMLIVTCRTGQKLKNFRKYNIRRPFFKKCNHSVMIDDFTFWQLQRTLHKPYLHSHSAD